MAPGWVTTFVTLFVCTLAAAAMVGMFTGSLAKRRKNRRNTYLDKLKAKLLPLHPKVETVEFFEANSSYTEDKEDIYLCMRDADGNYYDENTLVYVAVHEIAHVLSRSVGHTEEFHKILDQLMIKAAALGIYDPNRPIADVYCGIDIPESSRLYRLSGA